MGRGPCWMLRAQKARSDATSTLPLFFSKNPKCGINDSESSWKPPHGQGHILTFMFPRRLVRSTTRSLLMRSLFGKRRQRNESHTCRDRDPRETSTSTAMKPTHRADFARQFDCSHFLTFPTTSVSALSIPKQLRGRCVACTQGVSSRGQRLMKPLHRKRDLDDESHVYLALRIVGLNGKCACQAVPPEKTPLLAKTG